MTRSARAVAGGCNGTHFNGAHAVAANGGPVCMYSPTTFEPGSSISHLDEATYITSMMKPTRDVGDGESRNYNAVEVGIMADLGYTLLPVPESSTLAMFIAGLIGVTWVRRAKA